MQTTSVTTNNPLIQMSTEEEGYRAESPENKVSILKAEADEVLAFAMFSKFLEIQMFSPQRKEMLCDYICWANDQLSLSCCVHWLYIVTASRLSSHCSVGVDEANGWREMTTLLPFVTVIKLCLQRVNKKFESQHIRTLQDTRVY